MTTLAFWTPGATELIVIGVVFMLLFGASRIPKLARSLGQSIVELRKGLRQVGEIDMDEKEDDDA